MIDQGTNQKREEIEGRRREGFQAGLGFLNNER
jgi:hypothetical protein